jgi:ParB family transcriptional regulator, chromosome partitioning protein
MTEPLLGSAKYIEVNSMASVHRQELSPRTIGVKQVRVDELQPNPHNPRVLFDKQPLNVLKSSIEKVGILVPLTVYFDSRRDTFVILDGQRRWMCAKELGLSTVPVNEVAEPTLVQNIVTMFQIHKLREDWELMPTALKLELLMSELHERNEKRLATLTGLDEAVVARCKKLLDYPKKYQDMMLDANPDRRVKADFFIELYAVRNDRFVKGFDWFSPDKFTEAMLQRYHNRRLTSVTDFRTVKQHINNAKRAHKDKTISDRLRQFMDDDTLPVSHLEIVPATALAGARSLDKKLTAILDDIKSLDVDSCIGEEQLWDTLESLLKVIRSKLQEAGRRIRQ